MTRKLKHPDSGQTIEVEAEAVAMYQSQGWLTVSGRVPAEAAPVVPVEASAVEPPTTKSKK